MISGNLRYMKQCVYTRLQLNKCAKVSHTCYSTLYFIAYCIFLSSIEPRICIIKLKAQSNLGIFDLFDQNSQFLTNLEHLLRMLNTTPGHLRDMKQTISSAQIYECTKVSNIFNNTFYNISFMDTLEEFFLHLCFLSNQKLFSVTDDSSSLRIEFSDYKLNLLISIFAEVFLISIRYQACRNEDSGLINYNT